MKNTVFDRSVVAAINNMKLIFLACSVFSAVDALWRSIAFVTNFDSDVGYFDGSLMPTLSNCLLVISCAFALLGFFFIQRFRAPTQFPVYRPGMNPPISLRILSLERR